MKKKYERAYMMVLPFGLSIVGSAGFSWICLALLAGSVFAIIPAIPAFKHRENLGISIIVAICSVPINIRLSLTCVHDLFNLNVIGEILYFITCMLVFLSLEEIIFGIFARIIWRKQYGLSFDRRKEN